MSHTSPSLPELLPASCPLSSAPRSATPEPFCPAATSLLSPATHPYPSVRLLSATCRGSDVYFPCSTRTRHECPEGPRNLDTVLRYPCRHGSRSDNRLESVANAHTAADLHVRPVSKTALVSRSWAPRTI